MDCWLQYFYLHGVMYASRIESHRFTHCTNTSQILYDEHEATHAAFPTELAESVITGETNWNSASKCLLQWLNSLDAKASHLGGRQLLSPKSLEVSLQHRFGTHQVEGNGEGTEFTSEQESDEDLIEKDLSAQTSRSVQALRTRQESLSRRNQDQEN
jgi:hypothetical protein